MDNDIKIAPSILSADLLELGRDIDDIQTADYVHFDVMDGNFVPNLSFGLPVLSAVAKRSSIPVDVHLMISNPDEMAIAYAKAGASMVTFHAEAARHSHRIISALHDAGCQAGLVLNPGSPVCLLDAIITECDMVLLMSVNPGFGGQSFIESSLDKLRELSALCDRKGVHPLIEIDGGVSCDNAGAICDAGANVLVAGSSVYGAANRAEAISALRDAGRKGTIRSC